MSTLRCENLTKRYPDQEQYALGSAEDGVSFDVEPGELFALLGPSGCGKTTTLRIIGGFVEPTAGRVLIEGDDVTADAPYDRPTNTVFQSYALFPHLTVCANVEFGLKMDRVRKKERRERALEALRIVGLEAMADRRVSALSGGQQQRAALARAMVKQPSVLLLDEPFGALDLRLRRQMQDELVRLKQATGTTFVHVTHDQEEACAISDRIAVMDAGRIVQVDTPVELYRAPRTSYVATFVNAGTVVHGEHARSGDVVRVERSGLVVEGQAPGWAGADTRFAAVLPPDRISLGRVGANGGPSGGSTTGRVDHVTFTGSVFDVHVRVDSDLDLVAAVSREEMPDADALPLEPGSEVALSWDPRDVVLVEDTGGVD